MQSAWLCLAAVLCLVTTGSATGTILECSNPLPGVRKMIRGVDITELDMLPLDVTGSRGFKNPVLNFTCNQERVWVDRQGDRYQLPDQVWHTTTVPAGWLASEVQLYKSHRDVRASQNRNLGLEGVIKKFSFSASGSYSSMQHTIANESKYISDVTAFESATKVDMVPRWVLGLDRFAQMFIDQMLSGTFDTNRSAYMDFIREFGTHYFSTANFGGIIRVSHATDTSYFYSKSDREAKANAKASFLKILSAHGGQVSGSTQVDSKFTELSTKTIRYYGGNTNLMASNGIEQWQPTVDRDPWMFSGKLTPISDLIRDAGKKSSMVKAVLQYAMEKHLLELRRLINYAKSKMSSSTITALEQRLTSMESLTTLVEANVASLTRDVEHQLIVPDWFKTKTQLCYKWRPDGDGGQCGGGASRLLCAKPNSMTAVYRDDTDRRPGGCRMQWGIKSSGFESWFSRVQVCYRWYPDGDGGQCGGGASRTLCASINNFSPEYRDDTDRRSGGCRMSWRLVVPGSAPLWMKAVKMCFSWYPDGDGGQCGPAASRDLCATSGQWTSYYRDDTDRRSGGCRMSWGVKLGI